MAQELELNPSQEELITHNSSPITAVPRHFKFVDVALLIILFILLASVLAPDFTVAIYKLLGRIGMPIAPYPIPVLIQTSIQEGLALALVILFATLRGMTPADLGFRPVGFHWILAGLGLMAVLMPVRIAIGLMVHVALGGSITDIAPVADENAFPIIGSPAIAGVPIIFMAGFVAPLIEELIFRAGLYTWLRQKFGMWPGIIVSSVIFGMIHPTVPNAVAAMILGLAFALLYEKSRSIWVPLILHVVNNTALMVLAFFAVGIAEMFGLPLQ